MPWALTVVVAATAVSMSTCRRVFGSALPVRVTVLVVRPRVKRVSPKLGASAVGVADGGGVAVGTLVGVSVRVGKAKTSAFIGTVTATA